MKNVAEYVSRFKTMYPDFCTVCFELFIVAIIGGLVYWSIVDINVAIACGVIICVSLLSGIICAISVRLRAVGIYAKLPKESEEFKSISDNCIDCIEYILNIGVVKFNPIEKILHILSFVYIGIRLAGSLLYDFLFMNETEYVRPYLLTKYMHYGYKRNSPVYKSVLACFKYFGCTLNPSFLLSDIMHNNYEYNRETIINIGHLHAVMLEDYHK